jgi:alcohol dehydrogenase YqhD (iron-dependent ADH family)
MNKFEFYNPVHIIFGAGEVSRIGEVAKELGRKALLVTYTDHSPLEETLKTVESNLEQAGIDFASFYGISPNPKISEVADGVRICKEAAADYVIGLGGGSAMDAAKFIAAGVYYSGDLWNMVFSRHDNSRQAVPPEKALPLIMIPTLPATGSEMNPTAVITNDQTTEKSYTWNGCLYPKISIVDPALTCSLPPFQTACGAADTISHVLEFYLTGFEDAYLNNRIQEAVMLTVMEYTQKILNDPLDVNLRGHLQWASIVALNGSTQPGDGWTPMHQLGHVLSAHYNIAHAASLSIIMPAWMKYFYKTRLTQYATLGERVFGVDPEGKSEEELAMEGIVRFEEFLKKIGMPTRLADVNVDGKDIPALTMDVVRISFGVDGKLRSRPPATRQDVEAVYRLAL